MDPNDTIAAVATPSGPASRGIVRLSGPRAWTIALDGFCPESAWPPPRFPEIRRGELRVEGLRPPLPAMLALWPAPRTFTGQAIAEVHLVGCLPILDLLLAQCLARGARHAEPGEFTLRAFLSGRIDLTRAEAVHGVIEAANPAQLDAALEQLAGGLSGPIHGLRDHLLDIAAQLEANLDFSEEPDVDAVERAALAADLDRSARQLSDLARRLDERGRPEGYPRVVLVGPPNAGKSRLFNALLGLDRAIVSPQAGTTRDYLTGLCDCDGLTVELVDTAGIEERAMPLAPWPRSTEAGSLTSPICSSTAGRPRGALIRTSPVATRGGSASAPVVMRRKRPTSPTASRRARRQARASARCGPPSPTSSATAIGRTICRRGPRRVAAAASSGPRRRCRPRPNRCWHAAEMSWWPSISGSRWKSSAKSSAPWSPTTSSTASSGDSASASRSAVGSGQ